MSIQFTQKEVDDIKIINANQTDHGKALQADIMKICDSLLVLTDKLEYNTRRAIKKKQFSNKWH